VGYIGQSEAGRNRMLVSAIGRVGSVGQTWRVATPDAGMPRSWSRLVWCGRRGWWALSVGALVGAAARRLRALSHWSVGQLSPERSVAAGALVVAGILVGR
jgi:hypothetical protein